MTRIPPSRESPLRHATLNETLVALLDEAPSLDDAVGLVTSAIRKGLKPESIRSRVLRARDLRRRALILEILADTEEGVESPLEYRFHHDVEDAHGLPQSVRQEWRKVGGRWIRSDCRYAGFGVVVELDGELAHPGKATPADLLRDNDVVLTAGEITLRYRWPHVAGTPCAVARQVATALTARGWEGEIRACGPRCGAV
ncbi:MAG: hypothetical protein Q4G64_07660 [bacterium]|nr:hypothetical protein [bacterium]